MPADFEYTYETDRSVAVAFDSGSVIVTLADGRDIEGMPQPAGSESNS